ncbi:MAG: DUF1592 domain-containing protein [Sandaracinaceae bacterium]
MTRSPRGAARLGRRRTVLVLVVVLGACQGSLGPDAPFRPGERPGAPPDDDEPLRQLPSAGACAARGPTVGPTVLRRLTLTEVGETLRAELGVDVPDLLAELPPDARAEGFTNNASTLIVPLEVAEGLMEMARVAVERIDPAAVVARFASCRDLSDDCAREVARTVGERLLRSPLSPEQVERYAALFAVVRDEGDGFPVAAGLVLEALLQAPQLVYRIESEPLGDAEPRAVSARELATRLAYTLWGAPPDEDLLHAAAAGALADAAQIEAHAVRMLADPRAREVSRAFFRDWFHLGSLEGHDLSDDRYPDFDRELARAMAEETLRFFDDLAWTTPAPLRTMLTAEHTFLNPRLAAVYGVPFDGSGWQEVDLSGVPERRGILTHASLLTVHAQRAEPSIVGRGLFLLHDVFCDSVEPPPPTVDAAPPEVATGASQREASEVRIANPVCGECHGRFDPLGHAFERYDAAGRHRTADPHGNALRQDGLFPAEGGGGGGGAMPYRDLDRFLELSEASPRAQACIAHKALQFAWGRPLTEVDGCSVVEVRDDYEARGGRYQDLVLAVVTHPTFRAIAPSASEGTP